MNKLNEFALVPKPPGALEKTKPGAKRVLSGMVADTLALVKKKHATKVRPLRIVIMDDEFDIGDAMKMLMEFWFNDATVLNFTDAEEALRELAREVPDLFTTDWNHPKRLCDEMFRLLAAKKAKCPVFLISASASRLEEYGVLKEYVDLGLNITLLAKPFKMEKIHGELSKHFSPDDFRTSSKKNEL